MSRLRASGMAEGDPYALAPSPVSERVDVISAEKVVCREKLRPRAIALGETPLDSEEIRDRLRKFVCGELLRKPDYPLPNEEPLITGGLIDSFSLAQVGVFVEETFNVYLPDTDLTVANMDTIDRMVACILKAQK
jgi:acyl carrier protein